MSQAFPPDQRAQLLQQLTDSLNRLTVQEMRSIANAWGWSLRGVLKGLIVEQMAEQLADAEQMAAGFRTLSPIQRESLAWLSGPLGKGDLTSALSNALRLGSGLNPSKDETNQVFTALRGRGLLIADPYRGYTVAAIYGEWLPGAAAAGLRHAGQPTAEPAMGAGQLTGHVEHLLTAIQDNRPAVATGRPAPTAPAAPQLRVTTLIQARPGLVTEETLGGWGYRTPEELALARMLLDLLLAGGLLTIGDHPLAGKRVSVDPKALTAWRDQSPAAHQQTLRNVWLNTWQKLGPQTPHLSLGWNELDAALEAVHGYSIRQILQWATRDQLEREIGYLRGWLTSLVQRLQPDTWFSFGRFCELVYHLQRDLLQWHQYYATWHWYRDQTALDPAHINLETWLATYGALVAACLDGQMRWLGFVQVAVEGERIAAFLRPSVVVERSDTPLPADTVRFGAADTLTLRNIWQASELRQLVRQIAVETSREREATTYRLDAATFREALRAGRSAGQLAQAFTAAGFPLPAPLAATLQGWQAKAGRHQIYDNLAVIEFGDDVILEEIRAATSLGRAQVYAVSPRCLVILDPSAVQPLVDELRKKGYTPQVVS